MLRISVPNQSSSRNGKATSQFIYSIRSGPDVKSFNYFSQHERGYLLFIHFFLKQLLHFSSYIVVLLRSLFKLRLQLDVQLIYRLLTSKNFIFFNF